MKPPGATRKAAPGGGTAPDDAAAAKRHPTARGDDTSAPGTAPGDDSDKPLATRYQPRDIEQRWYRSWEERGCFRPRGKGPPYCIMLPPPNVTGSLHMGHGFQHTLIDILIRYHRMRGYDTLWQGGTDHAGIATQMVVERQLEAAGESRHKLGRKAFLDKVWQWKEQSGGRITQQLRRLGFSVDWSRARFTMDAGMSEAVQKVFIQLYEEGLIYRGERLVNWDPVLQTALSDLEVNSTEEAGSLWHLRYPLADGAGFLSVATTRPETMLGDTAVAVHPEDSRYRHLVGREVLLPLVERRLPIVADAQVDASFGSGCVKITPGHDFKDYALGQRHRLPLISIFTPQARINDAAPPAYRGLDRFTARKRILRDLEAQQLLEKTVPHRLHIPRGDRSGAILEPLLTKQWFLKADKLAAPALEAVRNNSIRFLPGKWANTYYRWMEDIQDWCISRQLWWGHRIPAWYDAQGNCYVGQGEEQLRARHRLSADVALRREEDVLDTWFSSALWTFATLGWPKNTPQLKKFHPTNVLLTGFDIIFFWVARMIMMSLHIQGEKPFHEVYVHGLVRDSEGRKMSKSEGNILDPIDLIDGIGAEQLVEKRTRDLLQPDKAQRIAARTRRQYPQGIESFGADALRFTFCSLASTGRDINFDVDRIRGYRNFCNKIWNAARYVFQEHRKTAPDAANSPDAQTNEAPYSLAERWIRSRTQETIGAYQRQLEAYRFDRVADHIYHFAWHEYCDWFLEFGKVLLRQPGATREEGRRITGVMIEVLEQILQLLHPLIPFISEELWQQLAVLRQRPAQLLIEQPFPELDDALLDAPATDTVSWMREFVLAVRQLRSKLGISPATAIDVYCRNANATERERLAQLRVFQKSLAGIGKCVLLAADEAPPPSSSQLLGMLEIHIPLDSGGAATREREALRLKKELQRLEKSCASLRGKLSTEGFLRQAPAALVEQKRKELIQQEQALVRLTEERKKLD